MWGPLSNFCFNGPIPTMQWVILVVSCDFCNLFFGDSSPSPSYQSCTSHTVWRGGAQQLMWWHHVVSLRVYYVVVYLYLRTFTSIKRSDVLTWLAVVVSFLWLPNQYVCGSLGMGHNWEFICFSSVFIIVSWTFLRYIFVVVALM